LRHASYCRRNKIIYGLIETPSSLLSLPTALRQATQIGGLIFGAEDYALASGITRSPSVMEMVYARQKLVCIAKANNLQVFDLVHPRRKR
jgi:citrate lyase beta subunit